MNFWKFYDIWEIDIKSFNRLRVRFDRTVFNSVRFGKSLTFDSFTVSDKTFFGSVPRPKTERSI